MLIINSVNVSTIGLIYDIFGVVLLIFKVIPPIHRMMKREKPGGGYFYEWDLLDDSEDPMAQKEMKKMYKLYIEQHDYLIIGVIFIVTGFAIQIISNYI